MATYVGRVLHSLLGELRVEPTAKQVSARSDGQTVVRTRKALLVWEPGRVVPQYAVPEADLTGELVAAPDEADAGEPAWVTLPDGTRILPPGPFTQHTAAGQPLTLRVGDIELTGAAFRAEDPDLAGHVILDFNAFDTWYDDDEPLVAHPRDPFTRIDIRPASHQVRIEVGGTVLADSQRPVMLYETFLPVRTYLPRADVRMDLMAPSATRSECAYKGEASYWAFEGRDVAWTYERPLVDSAPITDLICFFDERVDVLVDGVAVPRAPSPWAD